MILLRFLVCLLAFVDTPGADVEWPVNGGAYNIRYSALRQITRENVGRLRKAWAYDSGDACKDSEMQSNPIIVGGILYATTPKMRVAALNAENGRELWAFDPAPARRRDVFGSAA